MNPVEAYQQSRDALFAKYNVVAESKVVSTGGPVKNVHYLELGEGKPLILIHGGLSHSSEWVTILSQSLE